MNCPFCGEKSKVFDSRTDPYYNNVRRRRECQGPKCRVRFTSIEVATLVPHSASEVLDWVNSPAPTGDSDGR